MNDINNSAEEKLLKMPPFLIPAYRHFETYFRKDGDKFKNNVFIQEQLKYFSLVDDKIKNASHQLG